MARITWVQPEGNAQTHDVVSGVSLMQAARVNGVADIVAECGGSSACGTCKVIVSDDWSTRVGVPGPLERSLIEDYDVAEGHFLRLSCQITVTELLDGLVILVPPSQT